MYGILRERNYALLKVSKAIILYCNEFIERGRIMKTIDAKVSNQQRTEHSTN